MYFHSIKLSNYKSMGEDNNLLIIEPKITTLIGKNESGKTKIINGLKSIDFVTINGDAFNNENKNRKNGIDSNIEFEVVLKPNKNKGEDIILSDTTIIINKDGSQAVGGILDAYKSMIKENADRFFELIKSHPFQFANVNESNKYSIYKAAIQNNDDVIKISVINSGINYLISKVKQSQSKDNPELNSLLTEISNKWGCILNSLPKIFYRNDRKILSSSYKLDDVIKELENPNSYPDSLLYDFVKIIDIPKRDFVDAVQSGIAQHKISIREEINERIDKHINKKFNEFYKVENVKLKVSFNNNMAVFSVKTNDGATLTYSERSNGLRWYLDTFIDILANDVPNSNVLYLFDEPGTSLHINAQKEVLNLFSDLCEKGNQLLYSTHFPSMLDVDGDGIHRIRSIFKNEDGQTIICKTAYDQRLSPIEQQDVYAPLLAALGMSAQKDFFFSKNKINVVCEGTSDYIYLKTFSELLNESRFNFIPSFGVTDALKIYNILTGWGYSPIVLFDFDKEGVEKGGNAMIKTGFYELNRDFVFTKNVNQNEIDSKSYSNNAHTIEDVVGKDVLLCFIKHKNLSGDSIFKHKPLLAKLFCNDLCLSYDLESDSFNNFKSLFERINEARNQVQRS